MFESLTVMHPQLLAQLEALQEQKSMFKHNYYKLFLWSICMYIYLSGQLGMDILEK